MRKGERTRRAAIEEALRLASTVGLEGVTIGALAEALGLSKSGLFGHFRSKENLQLEVLEAGIDLFVQHVVVPALRAPRGEPRVRRLTERWLAWAGRAPLPGGCLFVQASADFDDRPGEVRERLRQSQRDWIATLARAASIAVDEGHFRPDLDPEQFAFEHFSLMLSTHHFQRLLDDPKAHERLWTAFERLLDAARAHPRGQETR